MPVSMYEGDARFVKTDKETGLRKVAAGCANATSVEKLCEMEPWKGYQQWHRLDTDRGNYTMNLFWKMFGKDGKIMNNIYLFFNWKISFF